MKIRQSAALKNQVFTGARQFEKSSGNGSAHRCLRAWAKAVMRLYQDGGNVIDPVGNAMAEQFQLSPFDIDLQYIDVRHVGPVEQGRQGKTASDGPARLV